MAQFQIEICPHEPRAGVAQTIERDSAIADDLIDCTRAGDAEPAAQWILDTWNPVFTVWDPALKEYRIAKPSEIQSTCEHLYFDHEPGEFADQSKAALYLIWEAAGQYQQEREREESDDE